MTLFFRHNSQQLWSFIFQHSYKHKQIFSSKECVGHHVIFSHCNFPIKLFECNKTHLKTRINSSNLKIIATKSHNLDMQIYVVETDFLQTVINVAFSPIIGSQRENSNDKR